MINKLSHVTIYVLDQDRAREFYVDKLGFEIRSDATMEGGFRWLTVGPKAQPCSVPLLSRHSRRRVIGSAGSERLVGQAAMGSIAARRSARYSAGVFQPSA